MLRILKQYYPIRNIFFVLGEGMFILFSVLAACAVLTGQLDHLWDGSIWLKVILISATCQMCLYYNDLYDITLTSSFLELGIRLFQALGAAAILLASVYFLLPEAIIAEGIFIVSIILIIIFIVSWRFLYKFVLDRGMFNQKIILLGSGEIAQGILEAINIKKDSGYTVSARVSSRENLSEIHQSQEPGCSTIYKKGYEGLCDLAEDLGIKKIVVALKDKRGILPMKELLNCRVKGIDILEGNSFYEMLSGKLIVKQINPGWLIFTKGFEKSLSQRRVKRMIDLIAASVLLILLSPVIALISLMIKLETRGPLIFSQNRVGKDHTSYRMYKFRSMVDKAEKDCGPVWAECNDHRITRVGRYIRWLRLDELPQLWNVLKGDMSFVGPRPERSFFVKQLEEVIPYYRQRFIVKPGITGWAQISYGYGASEDDAVEKLNYDLFYIKNLSIFMDLLVIFKTIKIVLFAKGAR